MGISGSIYTKRISRRDSVLKERGFASFVALLRTFYQILISSSLHFVLQIYHAKSFENSISLFRLNRTSERPSLNLQLLNINWSSGYDWSKGQIISKRFFCVLNFLQKNERKQVDMRYHSSKVEFLRSFFGGNRRHQKPFRNYLTFRSLSKVA